MASTGWLGGDEMERNDMVRWMESMETMDGDVSVVIALPSSFTLQMETIC